MQEDGPSCIGEERVSKKGRPKAGAVLLLGLAVAFAVMAVLTLVDLPLWGLSLGASIATITFIYVMGRLMRP